MTSATGSPNISLENETPAPMCQRSDKIHVMIRIDNISPAVQRCHMEALINKAIHHFKDINNADAKKDEGAASVTNYYIRMPQPVLWLTFPVGRMEVMMRTLEDTVSVYAMLNGCILDGSRLKLSLVRVDPERTDADIARDEAQRKADVICGVSAVGRRAPPENTSIMGKPKRKYDDRFRAPKRERSIDTHNSRRDYRYTPPPRRGAAGLRSESTVSSSSRRRCDRRASSEESYGRHRRSISSYSSQESRSYTRSLSPTPTASSDSRGRHYQSDSSYYSGESSSRSASKSDRSRSVRRSKSDD
eukprot:Tbor_TRINITY_DN1848_c0_g1::TRINITY_DN1848_c0_g1_i1::g.23112::m.23112